MAYKITKYAGKHKIKDVKTGKTVDIDIEKFMLGGAPEDLLKSPVVDVPVVPGAKPWEYLRGDNSLDGSVSELDDPSREIEATQVEDEWEYLRGDSNLDGIVDRMDKRQEENKDFNIANPYAGIDIPSAANYLGQSIQNKNTQGIVASGLKLTAGIGRNIVSGMGQQNRYNQVMGDFYKDQKKNRNPEIYAELGGEVQKLAYGGKKDGEIATGEFMRGVPNENMGNYNAEIEQGEYFQSNEGDIAEVVGNKHSKGGEKIVMEEEDRVLSDKSTLGAKASKMLAEKYGIKLKATNTYSDVLDKVKKKSKFHELVEEEAELIKKISDQDKTKDPTTRDFNLGILGKKREEVLEKKHPIEEQRKVIFEELFNMQEEAKPKEEPKENVFELGGKLESLAKEYGISHDRARELVQQYADGGKKDPTEEEKRREGAAYSAIPEGQHGPNSGLFGKVSKDDYESFVRVNSDWFDFRNFNPAKKADVVKLQEKYNSLTKGNKVEVDGKFGEQTASMVLDPRLKPRPMVPYTPPAPTPGNIDLKYTPEASVDISPAQEEEIKKRNGLSGVYMFPEQSPLPPSALQGTLKPEARFDRVKASEIDATPYLQSIKDSEQNQARSLEGYSPNVRQAVLANNRANSQDQESKIRMQVDTANLQSQDKAEYTNAQIQMKEQLQNNNYRQGYEQRIYTAQAKTDNDVDNYYNQLQSINKQRFMDIHNLNLVNATNEDVYFDGQKFQRKNSDQDLMDRFVKSKGLS